METFERFIAWGVAKNFVSVRSFMLYISVYMTFYATHWGAHFAETTALTSGTEIGIIIAAVTLPITGFTGFVYKWYSSSRDGAPDVPQ